MTGAQRLSAGNCLRASIYLILRHVFEAFLKYFHEQAVFNPLCAGILVEIYLHFIAYITENFLVEDALAAPENGYKRICAITLELTGYILPLLMMIRTVTFIGIPVGQLFG